MTTRVKSQSIFSLKLSCKVLFILSYYFVLNAHAEKVAFTISSAVNQALYKNPEVMKAREAINQSEYDHSANFSKLLPTLSASVQGAYQKDASTLSSSAFGGEPYNQYQVAFNLVQPIFDAGSMFASLRYSTKEKEIKNYELEITERTTTQSVIEKFYLLLLNERLLQILKDTYQVNQDILKIAVQYFQVGRIQKIDLLQLKTQTALLKPKITAAQNQLQTTASQIATLLHDLDSTEIQTRGKLIAPDFNWVKSMAEKKKTSLPEMSQIKTQIDQFEDSRTILMATHWPKLNLVGLMGRTSYAKTDLLDSGATHWSIGLQLNIPIFTGLSSIYQRNSLASQERQMEFDESKTADTVSANQIQTEKDLIIAESQLNATTEAAELGHEVMQEAEKSFRLSRINYLQYQNSLQAYLDSQTGFYQSKYNYIVAITKYFNALGIPLSNLVNKLEEMSAQ